MVSASRLLQTSVFLFALAVLTSCHQQKPDTISSEVANTNAAPPETETKVAPAVPAAPANPPPPSPPAMPTPESLPTPQLSEENQLLHDAIVLDGQGKSDFALQKVTDAIQLNPKSASAYSVRGQIYTEMKNWDQAKQAFEMVLQLDSKNTVAEFNLSELKFKQKDYDGARTGFLALEKDPDLGDFASFKVLLCDLLAGHEDVAKREFDVFNQAGSNPSFYFGNVAWYVIHKQPDQARSWLVSGIQIYAPRKVYLYTSSLKDLGYLPLPPPPPPQ